MKKNLFLVFAIFLANIFSAQTDLVRWALTSNGNTSYTDSRVIATSLGTSQNPISYSTQGMTVTGWNNGNVEHYRYFGFSVGSSNSSSLKISNLLFEQERLTNGPTNYTIRYYIAPNANAVDDYAFMYTLSTTILVNNESIASNPIKNIPVNVTLTGTQRLIIRFFASGNDYNAGWRIKANTLKLTEAQATVPVANNDSYSVYKNTSTDLNILSNDTSGSAITGITITQQPAHGTVTVNGTANVTYVPASGYSGTDSFKYKALNTTGSSNEATVSLNVITSVPVANDDSYSVYSNSTNSFNILSNDSSSLTITGITITQQPAHGTITVNGTTNVTYKPTTGYLGADTFKYQISNATGASNEATVSINVVQDPNTAVPVANSDSYSAYKNIETDFNVLSNDTSVLTISGVTITQQPAHGTVTVNGTTNVTYKPAVGYTGSDSFKYKAGNSTGLSNEATVSINVIENVNAPLVRWNNSNFAPSFTNSHIVVSNITSTQNISFAQNVGVNGFNYDAFQTSGWPDKNAQTVDTSKYIQVTISPKNGYKLNLSEFNFLCVTQGGDANIRIDYSLNSNFSNPKTILPQTAINSSLSQISLTNFSKPIATDGQVLYLRIYVYNTWNAMQILFKNGQNIGPLFNGYVEYSSTVPIAYNDTVTNKVNTDSDINVLVNDDYSNKITSLTFTQPSHGTTSLNADKSINYIPTKDYLGADSFTYYITNEYGVSNSATVSIDNVPNTTAPLIRWDKTNFTATPFETFIASTPITSSGSVGITVGGETNPRTFYVETSDNSTNLDTNRYIQFVVDNTSSTQTIEPKTFGFTAKGNGARYEIRYSKNATFASDVNVLTNQLMPANYTAQSFNFDEGLKLEPGEKVYIRLYVYNSYYAQFVMQFITGGFGPEISGIFYNKVYSPNNTIWLNAATPHWSNGAPSATKHAVIDTNYNTSLYGSFESNSLTVNSGANLKITNEGFVKVNGQIVNNAGAANFVVDDNSNILQKGNAQNVGNITVKKGALIPKMGYNYWSSPVIGQNLYQFSDGYNTVGATGAETGTPWNRFYVYNEANDKFVTSLANDITLSATSVFQPARGYAIRGKNSFPTQITSTSTGAVFEFKGVPQNGDVSFTLKYTDAAHGYNMVGNPYPSNIGFDEFFEANSTNINGCLYLWTNNDSQIITQQGSTYTSNNYALYNGTGGTSATYLGYNNRKPNGYIALGQGFIVQAKASGKNQPLVFNNSMRYAELANFYNKNDDNKAAQKDRFWIEFKSPTNVNNEILIGYIPTATDGFDINFDTELLSIGNDSFWSVLDSKKLGIQARQASFNNEDVVKLGIKASVSGNYTISVTDKEGIFNSYQSILLKDSYLNKVVDLKEASYIFSTSAGQFEDRFQIIYKNSATLGTDDSVKKGIQIYKDLQNFIVNSTDNLDEVNVYDALGRLIFSSKNAKKELLINNANFAEGLYIIKARSGNTTLTKKVLR